MPSPEAVPWFNCTDYWYVQVNHLLWQWLGDLGGNHSLNRHGVQWLYSKASWATAKLVQTELWAWAGWSHTENQYEHVLGLRCSWHSTVPSCLLGLGGRGQEGGECRGHPCRETATAETARRGRFGTGKGSFRSVALHNHVWDLFCVPSCKPWCCICLLKWATYQKEH